MRRRSNRVRHSSRKGRSVAQIGYCVAQIVCGVALIGCSVSQIGYGVAQIGCGVAQKECGVAQILVRRLAVRQARLDSRLGTSFMIPVLSGEDTGVGLNDCDFKLYVSIDKRKYK
jgi:hypothetical protein